MQKPVVDHLGVLVRDLDAALELMQRLFDLRPVAVKDKPEAGLAIAAFELANLTLELIQITSPESEFHAILGNRPGLNHLGLLVGDMDQALARFSAAGVALAPGFPRPGSRGAIAFNQAGSAQGLLFELCQEDS